MHWMIAEDESDIRNLVATMAQMWGHTTVVFESGGKAWDFLDKVEAGEYDKPLPEFALMDIKMPGKWGNEVAKRLRETEGTKNIPIVLMTAFVKTEEEVIEMKKETGVDMIINKPLPDFMKLKEILDGVIEAKKKENS